MSAILDQHKQAFEQDPSNQPAFASLEEHFFMAGDWDKLVALYERRLEAHEFEVEPTKALGVMFRLAQVLEERCLDFDRAIEGYWKVAKLDPSCRPALRQLRQIYTNREQWDLVLQISEMESQLEMEPHERASFLAELGNIWNGKLNDPTEALSQYQQALEIVPDHGVALTGLAKVHQGLGHHEQAAAAWERLSNRLRGPDRAPVLVSLGTILANHLDQSERAIECFQLALRDDARCLKAVVALSETATEVEDWPLVAELFTRRFDIASGASKRSGIAVEAAQLNLEKLDDTQAARMWLDHALGLAPDNLAVFQGLAELERRAGNQNALGRALNRVIELAGDDVAISTLLESADLYSEFGNEEAAVALLRRAQERAPNDAIIAETLSDGLARLGHSEELMSVLERRAALIDQDPQAEAEIRAEIGRIYLEDLDDEESAIASLVQAFDLCPSTDGVASSLERIYSKREAWTELDSLLERASAQGVAARRPHFSAALGELREQHMDDLDGAVTAYEAALALDPKSLSAHQGIARIVGTSGNPDELLRVCEREAEITSDRARLMKLVATMVPLLEERERFEDALRWLDRHNELVPDNRETLEGIARLRTQLGHTDAIQEPLERLDRVLTGREQTSNRLRLAEFHLESGRDQEAITWYQASLENDPNQIDALRSLKRLYTETRGFEELARTMRRLSDTLPEAERNSELSELATLLVDQLGDIEGAIVVLWRLVKLPDDERPADADERLEDLLERAGRYEELAQQLLERRRTLEPGGDDEPAVAQHEHLRKLDMRRANLYLNDLGQFEEAASLFKTLRAGGDNDNVVLEGLERALRQGNDSEGLVELLEELAGREDDPTASATLDMERATLLEQSLGAFDEARDLLTHVAERTGTGELAEQANAQLEQLLVRCGDWETLRERLELRLGKGSDEDDLELHEELARMCRDRLGEREACIEHLEAAGKLAPDRHSIWHNLAILYAELDRNSDLLRVLEHELTLELDIERETMLRSRAARLASDLPDRQASCSSHFERLLELEPGNAEATEFLLDYYEREEKPTEMVRLLRDRLDATQAEQGEATNRISSVVSLRLRIAGLESEALDDAEAAAATLAPAIEEVGPDATVARPLADLYLRLGHHDDFISLGRKAAEYCDAPEERATWMLQVGDVLRQDGEAPLAVEAYRAVLEACSENLDAQSSLRELYRELGDAASLADLLRLEADRHRGDAATPLLLELASLLAGPLNQHDEALSTFSKILDNEPNHPQAYVWALDLTRRLGQHEETKALLDRGLEDTVAPLARAVLLEQLADLTAGPLEDPAAALSIYREALSLDPTVASVRSSVCNVLSDLGKWNELLDCLFLELQQAALDDRCDVIERAIEIAKQEVSLDAALPWLQRLRSQKPADVDVLGQIASIHRQAGRPEALLRALEAQMPLRTEPEELQTLHCDIAVVLERDLVSPSRAAISLEAALAIDDSDASVLADLDRIYEELGRFADRAKIIEQRIVCPGTPESSLATLHRGAAMLWHTKLSSPETATRHLLHSIYLMGAGTVDVLPLLEQLQQTLHATGRLDGWARAMEAELKVLTSERDAARDARKHEIRSELARAYANQLARPVRATQHLLALLDDWDGESPLSVEQIDEAEMMFLDHLRRERNHVELERRVSARLERIEGTAAEWLELAALEGERLHRPNAARRAYRVVLDRCPEELEAIHGLRKTAEALHDWSGVAESFDRELALESTSRDQRCEFLRSLGEVAWRKLEGDASLDRAIRAYRKILEYEPADLESIRALQEIEEQRAGYSEAISYYELEIEQLAEREPKRRQEVWLRVAAIARDHTNGLGYAITAFTNAAKAYDLTLPQKREWAELYRSAEQWERFAEVYGGWCDAPGSPAGCADLLVLADVLQDLERNDEAMARAESATVKDANRADAWELAAKLREATGDNRRASEHWAEAAELRDASTGAQHLLHASKLIDELDPSAAAKFLQRGADHDATSQEIQARLALVCERLEQWEEAESAAGRTLDFNTKSSQLQAGLLLATALAGGRAAREREATESATRLFGAAHELNEQNPEAAESYGELLYQSGELRLARSVLEARLAMPGENPRAGKHHAIIGESFELDEALQPALDAFSRAAQCEANLDQAYAGIVRVHEERDDPTAAIEALSAWTQVQQNPELKSDQLYRAAKLLQSIEETESALDNLREATAADCNNAGAWTMLAELLLKLDEPDEALEVSTNGLAAIGDSDKSSVASLSFVRGTALAQGGDETQAIADYEVAVDCDPSHCDAALALSKIQTNAGDWQLAADTLGAFLENHPEPSMQTLARVHYERGQLLAGPLEQVEDAIACYERAVELDPDFTKAIEPLANLLSYLPGRWEEAVKQHGVLLDEDPARKSSIRSLVKICDQRGDVVGSKNGVAILRALGVATNEEFQMAATEIGFDVASRPGLPDPHWERLREMIVQASDEISQVMSAKITGDDESEDAAPERAAERDWWNQYRIAQAELSAKGFESLPTPTIESVTKLVAAMALESERPDFDRDAASQLDKSIGRWARRKLRKTLDGTQPSDVADVDWDDWRIALCNVAAMVALDRSGGALRTALLTLSSDPNDRSADELDESISIVDRVSSMDASRTLLAQVIQVWTSQIGRR